MAALPRSQQSDFNAHAMDNAPTRHMSHYRYGMPHAAKQRQRGQDSRLQAARNYLQLTLHLKLAQAHFLGLS